MAWNALRYRKLYFVCVAISTLSLAALILSGYTFDLSMHRVIVTCANGCLFLVVNQNPDPALPLVYAGRTGYSEDYWLPTLTGIRGGFVFIWPFWITFVLGIIAGGLLQRVPRLPLSGLCATCSYDLRGNVSGICPECGTRA